HPEVTMVATRIIQINAQEEELGTWDKDMEATTPEQIFRLLAKTNCIAHPTILMRKNDFQRYLYNKKQKGSEDWDLWMRLCSDGKRIDKISEVLLKYRIHPSSVTVIHNSKVTQEHKLNTVRITFLKERIKKLRLKKFELLVVKAIFRTIARDIKLNKLPAWLRFWKRLLTLSPFRARREFLMLKKTVTENNNPSGIFLFFPYTHVGGAEKVHSLIAETIKDKQPWIFFTGFSLNKKFLPLFENSGKVLDVAVGINHPFFIKRSRKLVQQAIHQATTPVIFGCNNLFFYDLIPHLQDNVKVIDLMHDFRFEGEEQVFKSYLPLFLRCQKRVFISEKAILQTKKFYRAHSVEAMYEDRLLYIPNYVNVPDSLITKHTTTPLSIIYVGRGTEEKRAYLVAELAKACFAKKLPVRFQVIGDIEQPDDLKNHPSISFTGELTDTEKLKEIYKQAHVLLITSEREGFPMAIMEGMSYGVIPISTPVGDIPKHIQQNQSGYLTSSTEPGQVLTEMINYIVLLIEHPEDRDQMSKFIFQYAKEQFSKEQFTAAYRKLVLY
ncbi:MAG TPA: glycosyltransferase, partial [Bacteroidia bacterium]|nr:glycosyltransferase [Bacteroidia bacterium]